MQLQSLMPGQRICRQCLIQVRLRLATDEHRKYFERDAALARRFQPVVVEAPSPALARQMLEVLTSLKTPQNC
jgi:ATP-dependent Clp protease ATP-binding subunit ClpA